MQNVENFRNSYYFKSIDDIEVKEKCFEHINLSDEDIEEIGIFSRMLPVISQLEGDCDTFIDCFTNDKNVAIVVGQCSPKNSVYEHSYIGKLIFKENEPGVFKAFEDDCPVREVKASIKNDETGLEVLVRQNITVLKNKKGNKIGVIITEKSMSSCENTLVSYIDKNYNIGKIISDCIVCFNKSGEVVFANEAAKKFYKKKLSVDEIMSLDFDNLSFNKHTIDDVLKKDQIVDKKIKDGNKYFDVVHSKIKENGSNLGFAIVIKDVTEKVLKDKALILKSLAVQEIHHRVKNNLQTIISLIRLQLNRTENKDTKKACEEIISRIFSIAITHEILANNGIDKVEIKEILNLLTSNTLNFVAIKNMDLRISVFGEKCYVSSDVGTTIAIIVNELLQNSISHGFDLENICEIKIKVLKENEIFSIIVSDNGSGYKDNDVTSSNLGLKLVKSLVKDKLMGDLTITSSNVGTKTCFTFKNKILY